MRKENMVKLTLIVSLIFTITVGLSVSYAFFSYRKESDNAVLTSGEINISFNNNSNFISLADIYPVNDNIGKIYPYYNDFSVIGVTSLKTIKYEIILVPDSNNTLDNNYVKVYLTSQDDETIVEPVILSNLPDNTNITGKEIYSGYMYSHYTNSVYSSNTTENKFRLRVYLDESYNHNEAEIFAFKVYLYAYNVD